MDIVRQYEELLKLDPGSTAFAPLAEELCYRGFWEGALKVCRQGLTHHPQHLRGRVLLGWALKELGEHEEAETVLVGIEVEIQKNALLFRLLAELAKKAGDTDRAERLLLIHQSLQPRAAVQPVSAFERVEPQPLPEPRLAPLVEPPPAPQAPPSPEPPPLVQAEPLPEESPELRLAPLVEPPPAPQAPPSPEPPPLVQAEPLANESPEPGPAPLMEPPPAPQGESPKDEIADFLSSLLDRYEALPQKSPTDQQLFSEDDRKTVFRILKSLRH